MASRNISISDNAVVKRGRDGRYHYLYLVFNLTNGKVYAGVRMTRDLCDGYFGSGGRHFKAAVKKYGAENFRLVITQFFGSRIEALAAERCLVDEDFVKSVKTYNKKLGGVGAVYNIETFSEQVKAGMSAAPAEEREQWNLNLRRAMAGKPHSAEHVRARCESRMRNTQRRKDAFIGPPDLRSKAQKIQTKALAKPVVCEFCQRSFNPGNAKQHIRRCSANPNRIEKAKKLPDPKIACGYCNRLIGKSNLARHEKICQGKNHGALHQSGRRE